jgi:hypothetical protein
MPLWTHAIGEFMVRFNECESWLYEYVAELVPSNLAEVINEDTLLKKRIKAAKAAFRDANLSIPIQEVDAIFKRLDVLAEFRNILAHNAPMACLYETKFADVTKTTKYEIAIELQSRKRMGKKTDLSEIQRNALVARQLSADMMAQWEMIVHMRQARTIVG